MQAFFFFFFFFCTVITGNAGRGEGKRVRGEGKASRAGVGWGWRSLSRGPVNRAQSPQEPLGGAWDTLQQGGSGLLESLSAIAALLVCAGLGMFSVLPLGTSGMTQAGQG